ncbi:MAG: hypothetical protein WEC12_00045 [Balneolaceae bacterium]
MDIFYIIYEMYDHQPKVMGIFDERSLMETGMKKLRRHFPQLCEEKFNTRFHIGYLLKPVTNDGTVACGGESYELNPDELKFGSDPAKKIAAIYPVTVCAPKK